MPSTLVSPSILLGHTIVFVVSWTAVLWLLQDAGEWVVSEVWKAESMIIFTAKLPNFFFLASAQAD